MKIEVPAEFLEMLRLMKTQDNACTSHPYFTVQQKHRIYGIVDGYNDDGCHIYYLDDDPSYNAPPEVAAAFDDDKEEFTDSDGGVHRIDDYTRVGYRDRYEFVAGFFTREAAETFIAQKKHRLKEPRIYVESLYDNPEMIAVRNFLLNLEDNVILAGDGTVGLPTVPA